MTGIIEGALIAVGVAVAVCVAGWLILRFIPVRSMTLAAIVAVVAPLVAITAGVAVVSTLMFLSPHDFQLLMVIMLSCLPFALIFGLVLARRVRSIQAASDAELVRRDLIASFSHDLRTPLAGMRAMAEALEDEIADDPAAYHRQMVVQIDQLTHLVDDLFEVARLQSGTIALSADRISLADLVSDALATHGPVAQAAGITLTGRAETTAIVVGDGRELNRALGNLIVNAIRATPADGSVEIVASQRDSTLVLAVTDTCGGIPADELPRVFDVAWRGTASRTPEPSAVSSGGGLGLAIVRGIAAAHDGTVDVTSSPTGCCFELRLPAPA